MQQLVSVVKPHLMRDVISRRELLANGCQRGLVHLTHAVIKNLDGVVALPLSWSLFPKNITRVYKLNCKTPLKTYMSNRVELVRDTSCW